MLVVEEELREAQQRKLPVRAFVQDGVRRDAAAERLVTAVSDYTTGFFRRTFTDAQIRRTVHLARTLATELGIPAERVYLASDIAGASSPGRLFPTAVVREQLASLSTP